VQLSILRHRRKVDKVRSADLTVDLENIQRMVKACLANPKDQTAKIDIGKQRDAAVTFFDKFVSSESARALTTQHKIRLLVLLTICCVEEAPALINKWIGMESEGVVQRLLARQLSIFARGKFVLGFQ
jgi:hypothetical protein